ncbi:MAG: EamA family transporter, partial [Alphaproteobacteria bacterium]
MNDNLRGALLMLAAMAGFTVNDAIMKIAFAELPFFQAIALRSAVAALLLGVIAKARGQLVLRPGRGDTRLIGWRTVGELGSTLAFLAALRLMPLGDITAILQALPLAVTLGAALFLGEPVGWRRLSAIAVGFIGVMLI